VRGQQSWNFVVSEAVCSTVVVRDNALKSHRITNRIMDPIDEIVNFVNASVASDAGTSEIVGEIATTGSDRFEEIMTMLRSRGRHDDGEHGQEAERDRVQRREPEQEDDPDQGQCQNICSRLTGSLRAFRLQQIEQG
jgi:hypothetical protein